MIADHLQGLEEFEAELWKIADNLRANSNLASNEYFMPIMGLLFLRQATNRYYAALEAIEADKKAGQDGRPRASGGRLRAPPRADASAIGALRRDPQDPQGRQPRRGA